MSVTVITGGCGFIGTALTECILSTLQAGEKVVLIDNCRRHGMHPGVKKVLAHPDVTFYQIDLSDEDALSRLVFPVDRLYHIAALIGVERASRQPLEVLKTNTLSTLNVFEWFERNRTPRSRLLFTSSSEVYAGGIDRGFDIPVPTPEDVPLVIPDIKTSRFSYAISKIWGEAYINYLVEERNIFAVSVRYHNVYGPSMGFDHVIPQVVQRVIKRENPFRIIGADQTRSFCWIEDAAEATRRVMESHNLETGQTVHVGNPNGEVSIGTLYEEIFKACGYTPGNIIHREAPPGSVKRRCPHTGLLDKVIGTYGWTPLSVGLKKTVEWYVKQAGE